ncbi:MAG: DUF1761 domain-containing protein [Paracoccaceae bacterium]|jgi:hypothetical protein|nr:DUF1761 domain-containing protein [Paracoccaceae bacterium]MDG1371841.1 DUF1761 domain-containing protein [Paracoccaceae bacterium]MDG1970091.1 DUF1761 domain-containing protein [Paracoccaceae bacterium]
MDFTNVIIAGIAGYAFGAVWYGILGKQWQAATGLTADDVKPSNNISAYIIGIVCNIVIAGMMRHIFVASGVAGLANSVVSGLGLGLFIAGAFLMINYSFAKRSSTLKWIDIGHAAGVGAVIGAALSFLI